MSPGSAGIILQRAAIRLQAAGISPEDARSEARILLCQALSLSHEALRMNPERSVSDEESACYDALIARREQREPLAYITGNREFYGLTFTVTPAVLIPRPETEFVVEAALRHLSGCSSPRIADIGTGSGAIATAIASHCADAIVFATDLSGAALRVAEQNACRTGVLERTRFLQGDFLAPLESQAPFDLIVSNPPYIDVEEIDALMPEVRDWEPRIALGSHRDALYYYRRFAAEAPALLAPAGALIVEVGQGQAEEVARLWHDAGLISVETIRDYGDIPRVVVARKR